MTRTTGDDLASLADLDARGALREAGFDIGADRPVDGVLVAALDGQHLVFDLTAMSYGDPNRITSLLESPARAGRTPLLVADRIPPAGRQLLNDAGWAWFDRSGRLHVRAAGVHVDIDVGARPRNREAPPSSPLRNRVGRTLAYQLLLEPHRTLRPTADAHHLRMAPSSLSDAMKHLRNAGLLDDDGRPVLPELFWELAGQWRTERRWLATPTEVQHWPDSPSDDGGWCLAGTRAAALLGADIVTVSGRAPDLYVPGPVILTLALRRHGEAADRATAAASIAVPATTMVTRHRRPPMKGSDGWSVAHPVAVALDLAQDPARGREILETWNAGGARVW